MPSGSTIQGCVCYLKGYYIVAFRFLCKGEAHGLLNKEGDAHKPLTRNPEGERVCIYILVFPILASLKHFWILILSFSSMHLAILFKTAFQHIPS